MKISFDELSSGSVMIMTMATKTQGSISIHRMGQSYLGNLIDVRRVRNMVKYIKKSR